MVKLTVKPGQVRFAKAGKSSRPKRSACNFDFSRRVDRDYEDQIVCHRNYRSGTGEKRHENPTPHVRLPKGSR
jgi:hypothetical protein